MNRRLPFSISVAMSNTPAQIKACVEAIKANLEALYGITGTSDYHAWLKGETVAVQVAALTGAELTATFMPRGTLFMFSDAGIAPASAANRIGGMTTGPADGPGRNVTVVYGGLVEGFVGTHWARGAPLYWSAGGKVSETGTAADQIGVARTATSLILQPGARA